MRRIKDTHLCFFHEFLELVACLDQHPEFGFDCGRTNLNPARIVSREGAMG